MYKHKLIVPKKEMYVDGKFVGPQDKHNWLWADACHEISAEDLEKLKAGDCLALNVDDEFVCFIWVKRNEIS